jgi:hypothetical protein
MSDAWHTASRRLLNGGYSVRMVSFDQIKEDSLTGKTEELDRHLGFMKLKGNSEAYKMFDYQSLRRK